MAPIATERSEPGLQLSQQEAALHGQRVWNRQQPPRPLSRQLPLPTPAEQRVLLENFRPSVTPFVCERLPSFPHKPHIGLVSCLNSHTSVSFAGSLSSPQLYNMLGCPRTQSSKPSVHTCFPHDLCPMRHSSPTANGRDFPRSPHLLSCSPDLLTHFRQDIPTRVPIRHLKLARPQPSTCAPSKAQTG